MIKLFLDIETLPCDEESREMVVGILKKKYGNAEKDPEELYLQSGFDGTFGRICCIAYIKEYAGGAIEKGVLRGDEKMMLREFWEIARDVSQFIGHNVMEFDLPFIYQRSTIQGVRPSQNLNFAKYRSNPIYDTMKEWTKWAYNSGPKLDTLAKVLSLPSSKTSMDGSQVWPAYQDGKMDEICAYCMRDVVLTRQVYYKMQFQEATEIDGIEAFTTVPNEESHAPVITASVITDKPLLVGETDEIPF